MCLPLTPYSLLEKVGMYTDPNPRTGVNRSYKLSTNYDFTKDSQELLMGNISSYL